MLARALGPTVSLDAVETGDAFQSSCVAQCVSTSGEAAVCQNVCSCIGKEIRGNGSLWQRVMTDAISPADRDRLDGIWRQCVKSNTN